MARQQTFAERAIELHHMIETGEARKLRLAAGLAFESVGRDCDVTAGAVLRWESGQRRPRGRNIVAYHRCLKKLRAAQHPMTEAPA